MAWNDWNNCSATTTCSIDTLYVWDVWTSNATNSVTSPIVYANTDTTGNSWRQVALCPTPLRTAKPAISDTARKKAMLLLRVHLSRQQREQLKQETAFELTAPSGTRYRIECTRDMHNVFELDNDGKKIRELCIYTNAQVPKGDNWLSQKLMLEADEETFRRIANHRRLAA